MSDLPTTHENIEVQDAAKLSDMVARGRTILEQDRDNSRREAIKGGGYDATGTFRGTK